MRHKLVCKITLAACLVGLAAGSAAGPCRDFQCFGGVDIAPEAEYSSNTREVKYVGRMKTVLECEDACIKYKTIFGDKCKSFVYHLPDNTKGCKSRRQCMPGQCFAITEDRLLPDGIPRHGTVSGVPYATISDRVRHFVASFIYKIGKVGSSTDKSALGLVLSTAVFFFLLGRIAGKKSTSRSESSSVVQSPPVPKLPLNGIIGSSNSPATPRSPHTPRVLKTTPRSLSPEAVDGASTLSTGWAAKNSDVTAPAANKAAASSNGSARRQLSSLAPPPAAQNTTEVPSIKRGNSLETAQAASRQIQQHPPAPSPPPALPRRQPSNVRSTTSAAQPANARSTTSAAQPANARSTTGSATTPKILNAVPASSLSKSKSTNKGAPAPSPPPVLSRRPARYEQAKAARAGGNRTGTSAAGVGGAVGSPDDNDKPPPQVSEVMSFPWTEADGKRGAEEPEVSPSRASRSIVESTLIAVQSTIAAAKRMTGGGGRAAVDSPRMNDSLSDIGSPRVVPLSEMLADVTLEEDSPPRHVKSEMTSLARFNFAPPPGASTTQAHSSDAAPTKSASLASLLIPKPASQVAPNSNSTSRPIIPKLDLASRSGYASSASPPSAAASLRQSGSAGPMYAQVGSAGPMYASQSGNMTPRGGSLYSSYGDRNNPVLGLNSGLYASYGDSNSGVGAIHQRGEIGQSLWQTYTKSLQENNGPLAPRSSIPSSHGGQSLYASYSGSSNYGQLGYTGGGYTPRGRYTPRGGVSSGVTGGIGRTSSGGGGGMTTSAGSRPSGAAGMSGVPFAGSAGPMMPPVGVPFAGSAGPMMPPVGVPFAGSAGPMMPPVGVPFAGSAGPMMPPSPHQYQSAYQNQRPTTPRYAQGYGQRYSAGMPFVGSAGPMMPPSGMPFAGSAGPMMPPMTGGGYGAAGGLYGSLGGDMRPGFL